MARGCIARRTKALQACLAFFVVVMVTSSGTSAQSAAEPHRQQAVCSLKLQGAADPRSQGSVVTSADLDCSSSSPVLIGADSSYLGKHVLHFRGVQVVSDLACQQQARGRRTTADGTRTPLFAVLYFCGDYHVTLLRPVVLNMTLDTSSDRDSAVLAFGGTSVVTISRGMFEGNRGGSTIAAFQKAAVTVDDHTVANYNDGPFGAGMIALDEATLVITDASLSYNHAAAGGAVSCTHNASLSIRNCVFHSNTASKWAGAVEVNCTAQQAVIRHTSFERNHAEYGGAVHLWHHVRATMEGSNFSDNGADRSGAAVYLSPGSNTQMHGCSFSANKSPTGAGMYCSNCRVQLANTMFARNGATVAGGGMYADGDADVRITNSTLSSNSADYGGAMYIATSVSLSLQGSHITDNQASTSGAGIYMGPNTTAVLDGCVFVDNNASYGGGGYCQGCTLLADRLSFLRNHAVQYGGGLDIIDQAQISVTRSAWQDNTADNGAGLACNTMRTTSTALSIAGSTFINNSVTSSGGACYLTGKVQAQFNSNRWMSNSAVDGGAVYLSGASDDSNTASNLQDTADSTTGLSLSGNNRTTLGNSTTAAGGTAIVEISSNYFAANSGSDGGGAVYLEHSAAALVWNSSMVNNSAQYGGALGCEDSTRATLRESKLAENSAGSDGGAIYCISSEVEILHTTLPGNRAGGDGGGVYAEGTAKVEVAGSNFTGCTADDGGAIGLYGSAQMNVSHCIFWSHKASYGGAVIAYQNSRVSLNSSNFGSNTAQYGGALSVTDTAQVFVDGCTYVGNSAEYGGAVYVDTSGYLALSNSNLVHNSANSTGGAMYLEQKAMVLVSASTLSENHGSSGGGIYACASGHINITRGTRVQGNNAADSGGALYAEDSAQVLMEDSMVSGNDAVNDGGGVYFGGAVHGRLTRCSVVLNEADGNGGGLYSSGVSVLFLDNSLVAVNRAYGDGGGIRTEDTAQLVILGDTNVTSNHAAGWGGGASLFSNHFGIDQVKHAVRENSGRYDGDLQSKLARLAIVGNSSILGFANRVGNDEGLLHIIVQASGYYGLPCQGLQAQAMLDDGTFLGLNRSDERGLVHMSLKIARPAGVYVVSLTSPDWTDVPAANLTLHIRSCVRGEVTPSPDTCQPCQQGFFSFDPRQGVCNSCPGNANCSGGDVITPITGFWRSSADSAQVHRCPNPSACIHIDEAALLACAADRTCGASARYKDLQCSTGYYGNLCGLCSPGAAATRLFTCRECLKPSCIIALYTVAAVVTLCLIKLLCHLTRNQDYGAQPDADDPCKVPAAQLLRPLILYSQYMLLVSSMPVDWPASISYPLKVLAWVWSPASPETLSIDCLLQRDAHTPISIQKVLFYVCMPLVILLLLLLIEMAHVHFTRARRTGVAVQLKEVLLCSTLVAVFFFFPLILRTLYSIFACVQIDQPAPKPYAPTAIGSYWVLDMNQQCFTGYHKTWSLAFGLPCLVLACLGLPLGVLCLLIKKRSCLADRSFRQHYGFLYTSYRQPVFYWECVVMFQTMVLVAISVFGVTLGVFYQGIVMAGALMLMVVLLLVFNPCAYRQSGRVTLQAVACLLLTSYTSLTFLQLGNIQPSPAYGMTMGSVVLLVNLVFVASVLWQLLRSINWQQVRSAGHKVCFAVTCGGCPKHMLACCDVEATEPVQPHGCTGKLPHHAGRHHPLQESDHDDVAHDHLDVWPCSSSRQQTTMLELSHNKSVATSSV